MEEWGDTIKDYRRFKNLTHFKSIDAKILA